MAKIKKICGYCGIHLDGAPCAPVISHGICHSCAEAIRRMLAGEVVEMRFYDLRDYLNQSIVRLDVVNAALIAQQTTLGRTEREIVGKEGE